MRRAQEQQQQQSEAGGHRRQHPESSPAVWRGRVRLRGEPGRAGTGLQGKRGDRGGGRETRAPAAVAAGGPIPGEEGAAEAESGPSSQRLCLLRSSLERRNQSRGRGWEGSGAGAWAGEGVGGPRGWQLRQSGGGTLGREPCAPGRRAQSAAKGGSRVLGRGPRALLGAGPACRPLSLPL